MKSASAQTSDDIVKTSQTKTTKKTTKGRAKSTKTIEVGNITASSGKAIAIPSSSVNIAAPSVINMVNTPTTPTPAVASGGSAFDNTLAVNVNGNQVVDINIPAKNPHKSYAGLEPRSIKVIWEQHDQSEMELQSNACTRLAEDVSYKLWELCNHIKTYTRHSGGVVTYDLVNEVLRDIDVPPALGAMDSDWDRIDYDGSFFYHTDKILELRDEYQKEESILMKNDMDIVCTQPLDDKNMEHIKRYVPSLINVILNGDTNALDTALHEVAFSPIIGATLRVILTKVTQLLAFKQSAAISKRCWSLLRACAFNPYTNYIIYREEYFHLAEVLICQLLAPFESIKQQKTNATHQTAQNDNIKIEIDDVKMETHLDIKPEMEFMNEQQQQQGETFPINGSANIDGEKVKTFKLKLDNNDSDDEIDIELEENKSTKCSSYFASPVDLRNVDELCTTIGVLAAENGFFQRECIYHITRRLERFFERPLIGTDKDYVFIGRCVRGLIALGENAFKEIIPYLYKLDIEALPETLCREFLISGIYLKGQDDIFLYEFLQHICGADKLQPFLVYYARFHDKLLQYRYQRRKLPSYKIIAKQSVRRLEWNTLAAAMCHGDDPNKSLKPKPTIYEVFPDLKVPNLQLNRPGTIRFKFPGCRPVILRNKKKAAGAKQTKSVFASNKVIDPPLTNEIGQSDILIARRKLYKPLTNDRYLKSQASASLSSYYYV